MVKNWLRRIFWREGSISARFRNCNIAILALSFLLMVMVMLGAFYNVIKQVSADYAGRYASSSAEALSAHISREIALMAKTALSGPVIDWMTNEDDEEKKRAAFEEMAGIIRGLHSYNLYVGLEKSRRGYKVEKENTADSMLPIYMLDESNPIYDWYFKCIASDEDYMLNVGIDNLLERKRMWINYRVVHNGVMLGVVCTGLEFSHVMGELFFQFGKRYNGNVMRGLIIDENGIIHMDSDKFDNEDFLHRELRINIENEITDQIFLTAIKSHLDNIEGYFASRSPPTVVKLEPGPYRYMTISPIRMTNWSAVILYDSSTSLNISLFLPVLAVTLILLIAFALANNAITYQLIFSPLEQLVSSLPSLKDNKNARIYGIERNDEFGNLSNTILDLFTKANYDALTGIYNRRFMENSLQSIMELLSRTGGMLSVLMIDVDYFKKYNDAYGHEQGDTCLKFVARALSVSVTRANDFVARYGGEEFIAVLPHTDEAGARAIAQKVLENVRKLNMPHADSAIAQYVTVSVGVTTGVVTHAQSWESYQKRADEALYASKQNGRNKYTYLEMRNA